LKKEFRAKEQEYETKIAVQQQKIELLEIKVKESEERETQQRNMYEKMFTALEQGNNPMESHINNSSSRTKKPEELFNSTSMSFGKEIEQMQK
jgi:multidrug resistance efflux pump